MVAMAILSYPIATFMSNRAPNTPENPNIQSSVNVSSSRSKLTKRKNYLRPKILKTLTKPHLLPLSPPSPEDPVNPIEPNLEGTPGPTLENQGSNLVEGLETVVDAKDSGLGELEIVQASPNVAGFSLFSGRMVVRIFASFVGLFILQTVVSVWIMGNGDTDEKDGNSGVEARHRDMMLGLSKGEVGLNGNAGLGNWGGLEMEAKIAEIRKMAREARAIEKRESLKSGEADLLEVSDDESDDLGSGSPGIQSGIVKEVDKRLTRLRKRSSATLLNVNFLNKAGGIGEERKVNDMDHKEEDDMLMFERKHKFRSHLNVPADKPKGFQSIEGRAGAREKSKSVDDGQALPISGNANGNGASSSNDNQEINGLVSSSTEHSAPLHASKNGFGNNGATKKPKKPWASKKKSGHNGETKELNKRSNGDVNPERGVVQYSSHGNSMDDGANVQDSSIVIQYSERKMSDQDASTTSKTRVMSLSTVQPNSGKLGSKLSVSRDNNWWSALPYVLVILMQTGPDNEGQEGFYSVRIYSDVKSQSYISYIVAFEDPGDARNFNYLLEFAFEDLPDAKTEVIPLSRKELKELTETLNKKVLVVKKGELKLYAGQPLDEVESTLRSLVK